MKKKIIGWLLVLLGVIFTGVLIFNFVWANYQYSSTIESNWNLADKASTISQKSDYIDKFVLALQNSGLQGQNDALIFFTPNNSFDQNFQAIQSLQSRLHEIKTMDESSFAYQTAIQQITAQEQGQADDMLAVFSGSWYKVHHYLLWNPWIVLGWIIIIIGTIIFGAYEIANADYD